jgi:AcrR family transcriptional regulator
VTRATGTGTNRRRKPKPPRRRRTAEQARREILDAAEKQLSRSGPDSIRLQDVASEVGVSHPTVLHHFGSRDELVRAVIERAFETLQSELVGAFQMTDIHERETLALLNRVSQTLGERGYARLLTWLMLSGAPARKPTIAPIRVVAEAAHAHRRRQGVKSASFEDTLFVTMLGALVMFADALVGENLRASAGLSDDPEAPQRFRTWLAKLIVEHAEGTGPVAAKKRR